MGALIGVDWTNIVPGVSSGKMFGLGDRATDHLGNEYIFAMSSGSFSTGTMAIVDSTYTANPLTNTTAPTAGIVGAVQSGGVSGDYLWVQVRGIGLVRAAANCAKDVPLYTTTTNGTLDDATASAASFQVVGVYLSTNNGAGTSNMAASILNYPFILQPGALGST
jgi:hypothetical protein